MNYLRGRIFRGKVKVPSLEKTGDSFLSFYQLTACLASVHLTYITDICVKIITFMWTKIAQDNFIWFTLLSEIFSSVIAISSYPIHYLNCKINTDFVFIFQTSKNIAATFLPVESSNILEIIIYDFDGSFHNWAFIFVLVTM